MTTSVTIAVHRPNHKRVRVSTVDKCADGQVLTTQVVILEHGTNLLQYLTNSRAVLLEEVD